MTSAPRRNDTSRWQTPGTAAGTGGEALHLQPNLHVWHSWTPPHSLQEELNWMTPKNPFYQCLCSPFWWCSTSRIPFIIPNAVLPESEVDHSKTKLVKIGIPKQNWTALALVSMKTFTQSVSLIPSYSWKPAQILNLPPLWGLTGVEP